MHCYVHFVPGRLRVRHSSFKHPEIQDQVRKALAGVNDRIASAEFNRTTGSLLIRYDSRALDHRDILKSLECAGLYHPERTTTNDEAVHRIATKGFRFVTKAFSNGLLETFIEGAALTLLSILVQKAIKFDHS